MQCDAVDEGLVFREDVADWCYVSVSAWWKDQYVPVSVAVVAHVEVARSVDGALTRAVQSRIQSSDFPARRDVAVRVRRKYKDARRVQTIVYETGCNDVPVGTDVHGEQIVDLRAG